MMASYSLGDEAVILRGIVLIDLDCAAGEPMMDVRMLRDKAVERFLLV